MNVSNILARKGRRVFTVKSSATLAAAANLLTKRRIGALVVTGAGGRITGIISERDIVQALGREGPSALHSPIAKAMIERAK
jgi:CBS domain-containing protein